MCYNQCMTEKVYGISSYVEHLALNSSALVHSVYERTINLSLSEGSMLAIQKESSPVSPLTVLAADDSSVFFDSEIVPGMCAALESNVEGRLSCIEIGNHKLVIPADAPRFDTRIPGLESRGECGAFATALADRGECASDAAALGDLIEQGDCATKGAALGNLIAGGAFATAFMDERPAGGDDIAGQRAAAIKADARSLFKGGDYAGAARCLTGLIGLGSGLTPAGDDFLTGVIAGIHATSFLQSDYVLSQESRNSFSNALFDELKNKLNYTHDISAAFLRASLDGHTSLPIKEFIKKPSVEAVNEISRIGHTSGLDALEGLLYFFNLLEV